MTAWLLWPQNALDVPEIPDYCDMITVSYKVMPRQEGSRVRWNAEASDLFEVVYSVREGRHSFEVGDLKPFANFVHWWRNVLPVECNLLLADAGHARQLTVSSHISRDRIHAWLQLHNDL